VRSSVRLSVHSKKNVFFKGMPFKLSFIWGHLFGPSIIDLIFTLPFYLYFTYTVYMFRVSIQDIRSCSLLVNLSVCQFCLLVLTLSLPSTTIVPYSNSLDPDEAASLDPDEAASNSPPHPDPSCLTPRQHFHQL